MSRNRFGARGPYQPWSEKKTATRGSFIKHRRREKKMTQAKYAALIRVSLRTLVTEEKSDSKFAPWKGSAVGFGMQTYDLGETESLESAFLRFTKEFGQ